MHFLLHCFLYYLHRITERPSVKKVLIAFTLERLPYIEYLF